MQLSNTLLELTNNKTGEACVQILNDILNSKNGNVQIINLVCEMLDVFREFKSDLHRSCETISRLKRALFDDKQEALIKIIRKGLGTNINSNKYEDYGVIDLLAGIDSTQHIPNLSEDGKNEDIASAKQDNKSTDDASTSDSANVNTKSGKGRKAGSRNTLNIDALENNPDVKKLDEYDEESSDDAICPVCGLQMKAYDEVYSKELRIDINCIVVKHHRKFYKCPGHEKHKEETPEIVRPKARNTKLISHSYCSNNLLAMLIWLKCFASLPLYRSSRMILDLTGINIPYKSMSNWIIEANQKAFQYIVDRLLYWLKQKEFIHIDETSLLVLRNGEINDSGTTKRSYLWAVSSSKWEEQQIVVFAYYPGRKGIYADDLLDGYEGYIGTDEFKSYDHFLQRCLCWVHLDRQFKKCLTLGTKFYDDNETRYLCRITILIAKLFQIEKECNNMSAAERLEIRQKKSKFLVNELFAYFHELVDENKVLPKSYFGNAINYALNREDNFKYFLNNGGFDMSNNTVENSIRTIAVGRKNWEFCGSPEGAHALANCYSLIETATRNNLNTRKYIEYIADRIERIPGYRSNPEKLDILMPWAPEVVKHCGNSH